VEGLISIGELEEAEKLFFKRLTCRPPMPKYPPMMHVFHKFLSYYAERGMLKKMEEMYAMIARWRRHTQESYYWMHIGYSRAGKFQKATDFRKYIFLKNPELTFERRKQKRLSRRIPWELKLEDDEGDIDQAASILARQQSMTSAKLFGSPVVQKQDDHNFDDGDDLTDHVGNDVDDDDDDDDNYDEEEVDIKQYQQQKQQQQQQQQEQDGTYFNNNNTHFDNERFEERYQSNTKFTKKSISFNDVDADFENATKAESIKWKNKSKTQKLKPIF